ncbi:hypothetical protein BR93DRAFT_592754 [Coniochaeta sp. PMI_546]|nr:hypothetical protein BR93DRAFT_592754 [Coniochaeta sp. PMI_546]
MFYRCVGQDSPILSIRYYYIRLVIYLMHGSGQRIREREGQDGTANKKYQRIGRWRPVIVHLHPRRPWRRWEKSRAELVMACHEMTQREPTALHYQLEAQTRLTLPSTHFPVSGLIRLHWLHYGTKSLGSGSGAGIWGADQAGGPTFGRGLWLLWKTSRIDHS